MNIEFLFQSETWYAPYRARTEQAISAADHAGDLYDRLLALLAANPEQPTRGEDEVCVAIVMAAEKPAVPRGWPAAGDPRRVTQRQMYQT